MAQWDDLTAHYVQLGALENKWIRAIIHLMFGWNHDPVPVKCRALSQAYTLLWPKKTKDMMLTVDISLKSENWGGSDAGHYESF